MELINRAVEVIGCAAGAAASGFTKLIGFVSAYVNEVAGANPDIVEKSKEAACKVGDKLQDFGKCAGKVGSKAIDKTMVTATGVAVAVSEGVTKALDGDEEKLNKVERSGAAMTTVGIALLATGVFMVCAAKRNKKKHR